MSDFERITPSRLADAFGVSWETAQKAQDKLGWLYRERATKTYGWQRIETAPKNFALVLLFEPGSELAPGMKEEPDRICVGYWRHTGFVLQEDKHTGVRPTHWMPLPTPPVLAKET